MKINKDRVKDYLLFAYVVATILGAYTWFVFEAGAQASSQTVPQMVIVTKTSK